MPRKEEPESPDLSTECDWHHYLKTHCNYQLVGGHGNWTLVGPDPPI